jgi:hypothetical protein
MEWLGIAELLVTVIGIAVGFGYRTLKESDKIIKDELTDRIDKLEEVLKDADKDNKEELGNRISKLEETLKENDKDNKEELGRRIDKLEENSRRDDETVKDLIKEAEERMSTEITARIRNIVELHSKIENSTETMTTKHEKVLERLSKMEGCLACSKKNCQDTN